LESEWRLNVWRFGMWGSDWELCARGVDPFLPYLYLVKRDKLPPRAWVYQILPGELPTFVGDYAIPPAFPHFPWGEDVFPD